MMMRRADVLIVGAGPAGSSLALRLARAGVHTLLLDARAFPRSKPCGDAISPGAIPLFEELGLAGAVEAAGAARLDGWRLRAPGGRWFSGGFRAPAAAPCFGWALPRAELDALLLEGAVAAGAVFLPRRRVFDLLGEPEGARGGRVRGVLARGPGGGEERHEARLVVGADGLRSRIARLLGGVRPGPRRRLALVGRFEEPGLGAAFAGRGEMRISAEGVLGSAPTGPDGCNLALVVPERRAPEMSADPGRFYRERLRAYGAGDRVATARRIGELEVTGPFEVSPRRLTAPGALLAGDAAGYLDPFTGQGIYRALALARDAAAAARGALERAADEEALLGRYARSVRRLLGPSRRVQRLIDAFVSRPRLMDPTAALLSRRPGLAELLVDVTGDRLPPGALADPTRLWAALRPAAVEESGAEGPASGAERPESSAERPESAATRPPGAAAPPKPERPSSPRSRRAHA